MPLLEAPEEAPREIRRIRLDTYVGMGYSNLISLFIIITTAATLHAHGVTDIQTSAQAAEALRPIAGAFTFVAVRRRHHRHRPAGGAGAGGILRLRAGRGAGLAHRPRRGCRWTPGRSTARSSSATLIGIVINFVDLDPIKALFWCAVINGVVAVPLMVVIMIMSDAQKRVMGEFTLPRPLWVMGWLCTGVMAAAVGSCSRRGED